MTRKTLLVFLSFLLATGINARSVGLFGHDKLDVSDTVRFAVNPFTGAIDELTVEGDKHHMNWIVKTDGSQYPWITERYSWGLGYFTQVKGHESLKKEWMRPLVVEDEGKKVLYKEGDVLIRAERSMDGGDLIEEYTFTNKGGERIWLYDIGITLHLMIIIRILKPASPIVAMRMYGMAEAVHTSMRCEWVLKPPM